LKQKEYLYHKFEILKELGAKTIGNKYNLALEFVTQSLPILTQLRKQLYRNGRKTLTKKYLDKITSRGLAYWIMDDGSLVWHKRKRLIGNIYSTCEFYLAVNCFSKKEIIIVQKWLMDKYIVDSFIRYHKPSNSYYLVINRYNYLKLVPYIEPYIIPSMKYKIDMSKLGSIVID
jgi:hypothetical protein